MLFSRAIITNRRPVLACKPAQQFDIHMGFSFVQIHNKICSQSSQYVSIYICAYVHMYVCVYVRKYVFICIYACLYVYLCIQMYVCVLRLCLSICITQAFVKTSSPSPSSSPLYLCLALNRIFGLKVHSLYASAVAAVAAASVDADVAAAGPRQTAFK